MRGRQRRREECTKLRAPYVLADDMRGNELSDFMHQKRDTRHRLDCQRFLSRISEMNPPTPPPRIISLHPLRTSFRRSLRRLKARVSFVSLMVKFVRSLNSCLSPAVSCRVVRRCHGEKRRAALPGAKSDHFKLGRVQSGSVEVKRLVRPGLLQYAV